MCAGVQPLMQAPVRYPPPPPAKTLPPTPFPHPRLSLAAGAYKSSSSTDSTTPAIIPGYTFTQIAAGYQYSLGLLTNRTLIGWGYNGQYTLGSAPGTGTIWPPVLVSGGSAWSKLADIRLSQTACAYNTSNALLCWGYKCAAAEAKKCSRSSVLRHRNENATLPLMQFQLASWYQRDNSR